MFTSHHRLAIMQISSKMGPNSTTKQRIQLAQQRQKVVASMKSFETVARKFLPTAVFTARLPTVPDAAMPGVQWDDTGDVVEHPETTSVESNADPDESRPETHSIALPSTMGYDFLKAHSLTHLAAIELELRRGQMNDALQAIRTGIGYKSLLYRTKVRKAKSYKTKLRSYDEVSVADDNVRKHVRVYLHARLAITRLYDWDDHEQRQTITELLTRYRNITREDLRANTTVLEAFTPGLRQMHASWIWHFEDNAAGRGNAWMDNCKCCFHCSSMHLMLTLYSPSSYVAESTC